MEPRQKKILIMSLIYPINHVLDDSVISNLSWRLMSF